MIAPDALAPAAVEIAVRPGHDWWDTGLVMATCPSCKGSGVDVWMTSDSYRGVPLGRQEQWYSESNCHDCDGAGQVTEAVAGRLLAELEASGAELRRLQAIGRAETERQRAQFRAEMDADPDNPWNVPGALDDFMAGLREWHDYCAQFSWNHRPEGAVSR